MSTTYADTAKGSTTEHYEACQSCGAPMDAQQRYCVNCAARRPDVDNPAARYLAAASRRAPRATAATGGQNRSVRGAAVILLLLLPVAVGIGVVVGRGNQQNDNSALLAALHRASGLASTTGASSGNTALASDGSGPLTSDFSLQKGWTVELRRCRRARRTNPRPTRRRSRLRARARRALGSSARATTRRSLTWARRTTSSSGEFKQKGQAEAALKKLKSKFPDAQVLQVSAAGGSTNGGSSAAGANAGGATVAQTSHGVVHQVTGIKPTKSAAAGGADREPGRQPDRPQLHPVAAEPPGRDRGGRRRGLGASAAGERGLAMSRFKLFRPADPSQPSRATGPQGNGAAANGAGQVAAAHANGSVPSAATPAAARNQNPELHAQRDRLLQRFTVLQMDLGGAFYEMAIRDHVRLDALTRKAAELQRVDSELAQVERMIELERTGVLGRCPTCDAPYGAGVQFCSQCGGALVSSEVSA